MKNPFKDFFAKKPTTKQDDRTRNQEMRVYGYYDASMHSPELHRHFKNADTLDPQHSITPDGRITISSRARYEEQNNGYCHRVLRILCADTIGRGVRINIRTADIRKKDAIKERWDAWAKDIKLRSKLETARRTKAVDGECFLVLNKNMKFDSLPLDLHLIEPCDIKSGLMPTLTYHDNGQVKHYDGISFDQYGNPISYRYFYSQNFEAEKYTDIPERYVIHYAYRTRPKQIRGVSELASTVFNYNDMRRYSKAVVKAAEIAADMSFVCSTDIVDEDIDEADKPHIGDIMSINRGGGIFLPQGYKATQMKPEQPTATYSDFIRAQVRECAGSFGMPLNVALGDSSGYNYASGRLDHQSYHKLIRDERTEIEEVILARLWQIFKSFDSMLNPSDYSDPVKVTWMWDSFGHVDPVKEATAQATRLRNMTSNISIELAADGRDFDEIAENRAEEIQRMKELGLPIPKEYESSEMLTVTEEIDEDEEE